MKLIYIFSLTLLIMFSACQKNDIENGDNSIFISATLTSHARASEGGFDDGDKIGIYAVGYTNETPGTIANSGNYFGNGDNVLHTLTGGVWTPASAFLWAVNSPHIDVYGYYPYTSSIQQVAELSFTVDSDQSRSAATNQLSGYEASDFLWAKQADIAPGTPVRLNFSHAMSKININLLPGEEITASDLDFASVSIGGTVRQANMNLNTGVAVLQSSPASSIKTLKRGSQYQAIVIPQTISTATDFIIINVQGVDYKYKISNLTLARGQQYNYNITVSKTGLLVSASGITDWEDDSKSDSGIIQGGNDIKADPYFTGSFIQSWFVLSWSDTDWKEEITKLKSVGIDKIIIDQTFYYYDGTPKQYMSTFPVTKAELGIPDSDPTAINFGSALEKCLRNCEEMGMKVFLGLNYDSRYWGTSTMDKTALTAQMEIGNKVMDKILTLYGTKYPNALHGWYWSWEVNNVDHSSAGNLEILKGVLNQNIAHRNTKPLYRPFMLCPFMNPMYGIGAASYGTMWEGVFAEVPFKTGDIFAPQDCIGTEYLTLNNVKTWMQPLAKAVATKPGMEFWIDVETFTKDGDSAPPTRVKNQLAEAAKYASELISFSYTHYYSTVPILHEQYKEYYNNKP